MSLDLRGFEKFLREKNLEEPQVDASVCLVEELALFLTLRNRTCDNASTDDLHSFSEDLIQDERNSAENYATLYRYGLFKENRTMITVFLEILDGREMIENFYKRLKDEFDQDVADEIFEGIGIPPLGIRPSAKPSYTKALVERFLTKFDCGTCKEFFEIGLRGRYTDSYVQPAQLYMKLQNIDEFLKIRHENLVERLEKHVQDGSLFFIQEITEDVVSYVRSRPTIEGGIRAGNRVIITKIPYMAKQYLQETDEKMKRYWFCHNPWIREALKEEDRPIDPVFCGCSAGYFKNFWEAILGQPVRVEVLKSVINGDDICEFALHLPSNITEII
ncbi:MAG: hypothetical protein ACFFAY_11380 [Promethearchaeota archaeon]